jgi:hypothetical protein
MASQLGDADNVGGCHAGGVAAFFVECVGRLDTRGNSPRYRRLEILLRHAIERGVLSPGEGLPPERDLALAYGVSRTVCHSHWSIQRSPQHASGHCWK